MPWTASGTPYSYGPPTTVGHVVEVEDRRRRGHLPLERERLPRVRRGARAAAPRGDHVVDEHQRREPEHERAQRDEQVPARELLGVVGHAPRHALHADQVHRAERRVEGHERQPEVQLAQALVEHPPGHLREPVVDAGVDREQRPAVEHVVDVGDDEVGVRDVDVHRHHRQHHAGDAAEREHRQEARAPTASACPRAARPSTASPARRRS